MSLKSYLLCGSIIFAVIFGQITFGLAAPTQNNDEDKMMNFYRLPDPNIFPELIMDLEKNGVFEKNSSRIPALFFMFGVFRTHPDKAEKWCISLAKAGESVKLDVGLAIKNSNIPAATDCITKHLGMSEENQKKLEKIKTYDPTKEEHISAALLEVLWGMFVASGDTSYVHRIIDALEGEIDGEENLVSHAAEWSLGSMALQHQLVKDTLLERSKTDKGARKQAIDTILSKLESD